MTEHRPPWPADVPPEERGTYKLCGPFHSREEVCAAFEQKHGYAPECAHHTWGGWLVGPVREEVHAHDH